MENIEAYKQLMSTRQRVVILTHHTPDADALGSSMALAQYLTKKNHQVQIISPSEYPAFLNWIDAQNEVLIYSPESHTECEQLIQKADIIYCLDFSSYNRLQDMAGIIRNSSARKCIIDHHAHPDIPAEFMYWDVQASSTAEIVFRLIELMGDKPCLDVKIAEYIYAGIVTDTSSFKRPSTTKLAHTITAELIDIGLCTNDVQRRIYDNFSLDRLHFIGYVLKEKLKIISEYRTAYFVITSQELEEFHTQLGDTEGLVDYAMSVKDIILAAIIIEKPEGIKISLRSVGNFAVNDIAEKYFSGGGHKNAAAGFSKHSLETAESTFLNLLPLYQDQLSQFVLC
jgi:bifunctional oligoribonuclease and PAP phosphatase NrnA